MEPGRPFFATDGRAWVRQQLHDAGYDDQSDVAYIVNMALDTMKPSADFGEDEARRSSMVRACLVLSSLLLGNALPEALWSPQKLAERTHTWAQVLPRTIRPGDVVRVRSDAYGPMEAMYPHNGREGTVQAIRNGVLVIYSGRAGIGVRHPIEKLEKRVPVLPRSAKP